jgi:3-methyladenine DNA glycosylase Mpg
MLIKMKTIWTKSFFINKQKQKTACLSGERINIRKKRSIASKDAPREHLVHDDNLVKP